MLLFSKKPFFGKDAQHSTPHFGNSFLHSKAQAATATLGAAVGSCNVEGQSCSEVFSKIYFRFDKTCSNTRQVSTGNLRVFQHLQLVAGSLPATEVLAGVRHSVYSEGKALEKASCVWDAWWLFPSRLLFHFMHL